MVIYFVRTVCELIRLNSDTGPPARMQEAILRVLAVFLDGLEMMVTGAESNVAHGCGRGRVPTVLLFAGGCSDISRESWKFFALAVPVTCKNLNPAVMLPSRGAFCSGARSPFSDTMHIVKSWLRIKDAAGP